MAGRRIDYVLQYCDNSASNDNGVALRAKVRVAFEKLLREHGFAVLKATVDKSSFTLLHCSEERLQQQAEKMLLKMPLKESTIEYSQRGLMAWLCNSKSSCSASNADDSEKGTIHASSSFSCARANIFKMYDKEESTLFQPAIRNFLVYNILSEIDVSSLQPELTENARCEKKDKILAKKGLTFLLSKRIYQRAYPLADDCMMPSTSFARTLEEDSQSATLQADVATAINVDAFNLPCPTWVFGFNFVSRVRERVGEEVAFYYAWVSVMMQLLIILSGFGVILYALGVSIQLPSFAATDSQFATGGTAYNNFTNFTLPPTASRSISRFVDPAKEAITVIENLYDQFLGYLIRRIDNLFTWIFGFILCLWGTLACEAWKRECAVLAHMWHVEGCNVSEAVRPEFTGVVKTDPHAEGRLISEQSSVLYWVKRLMALIVTISTGVISLLVTILCTDFRLYVDINHCSGEASSSGVCSLLIVTTVLVNVILSMFVNWVASKIARCLTNWENHLTQTEHSSALAIKFLALSAINGYIPMYYIAFFQGSKDTFVSWSILRNVLGLKENDDNSCGHYSTCTPILAIQLIAATLLKPFLKILLRAAKSIVRKCKSPSGKDSSTTCARASNVHVKPVKLEDILRKEMARQPSDYWVIEQYQEKILLFGYVMLFSASMPLVPAFVLIVHAIEHWLETRDLLQNKQRPVVVLVQDIGIWKGVFELMNIVGVVTTCFLTASMISNPFQATEIGRLRYSLLIMILMIVVKSAFAGLIPDTPKFVVAAQRQEKYIAQKELCSCSFPNADSTVISADAAAIAPDERRVLIDDNDSLQCCRDQREVSRQRTSLYPNLEDENNRI